MLTIVLTIFNRLTTFRKVNGDGEDSVNGIPLTDDLPESKNNEKVDDDGENSINSILPTEDSPESRKDDEVNDDCEDNDNGIPLTDDFPESKNNHKVDDDGEDSMCKTRPVLPDLVMEKINLISIESNPEMIFSLNKVCQFFSTIIQKNGYKYPTLYISRSVLKSVP